MSRRIVLKSVTAVVMVGFVLSFASCQKEERKIIGKWKCEKSEITDFACSDPFMTIMLKPVVQQYLVGTGLSGAEIEFTRKGKVMSNGVETANYTVNDHTLTLTSQGSSQTVDISFPDKKTMRWTENADGYDLITLSFILQMILDEEDVEITKCTTVTTFTKQ